MRILKLLSLLLILCIGTYYFYPENHLSLNTQIDSLIVYKANREMEVYSGGSLVKTFAISLGRNPIGDKEFEGDKKTPEGKYIIDTKNSESGYHKNLGISYPNESDIENAKKNGKPTGGDIKIHGLKNKLGFIGKFHRWFDWTMGCIAVTNEEIDELFATVPIGTKIEIRK